MEIEYLNRKTKVTLPGEYDDFLELLKKTFYISDTRMQNLSLTYLDDDNEEITIDEDEYTNEDSRKAKFWKLIIEEGEDTDIDISSIKKQLNSKKQKLIEQVKLYKENLYEECNKIIEDGIKKRNEVQQENINKIKNEYLKELENIKKEFNSQIKTNLDLFSENMVNVYKTKLDLIEQTVKENIGSAKKELEKHINKDLDDINLKEIDKEIDNMKQNIDNCMKTFNEKISESKTFNAICQIDENISDSKVNVNVKNGVKFGLNIKNNLDKKLTGQYILELRGFENNYEKYEVELSLSNIDPKDKKEKQISFKPSLKKEGRYKFICTIKENNKIISNECILNFVYNSLGSTNDMI